MKFNNWEILKKLAKRAFTIVMYDGVNFDIKSISVTILLKIPKMNT